MTPQPVAFEQVLRSLLFTLLRTVAWVVSILLVLGTGAWFLARAIPLGATFSLWFHVFPQALGWVLFGMAIYFTTECLSAYVAMGVSRARFVRAAALALGATSLGLGVLALLTFQVEAWLYGIAGWEHAVSLTRSIAANGWLVGVYTVLLTLTLGMSGLLVGWSYVRFPPLPATSLLVITVLVPGWLIIGLLQDPDVLSPLGLGSWHVAVRVLAALALNGLMFLAAAGLVPALQLRSRVP